MPLCHVHGWYSEDDDGCWMCRDAEQQVQSDRDAIIARLDDARRGPGAAVTNKAGAYTHEVVREVVTPTRQEHVPT